MRIANREIFRVLLITLSVFALATWVWELRDLLTTLAMTCFLALALAPAVNWLQTRHIRRGLAVGICYLFLIGALVLFVVMLVPAFFSIAHQLISTIPDGLQNLSQSSWFKHFDEDYQISKHAQEEVAKMGEQIPTAVGYASSLAGGAAKTVIHLIVVLVLAFYLIVDGPQIKKFIISESNVAIRESIDRVFEGIGLVIKSYLLAVLLLGMIGGIITTIILTALGVPNAPALGALVAVCTLVPLIGGPISAVIVAIFCAFVSLQAALVWLILYTIYQQFEGHILQPFIYRRTVEIHPLVVIPAILVGTTQIGFVGALLAVPTAAVLQVLLKEWWMLRKTGQLSAVFASSNKSNEEVKDTDKNADKNADKNDTSSLHKEATKSKTKTAADKASGKSLSSVEDIPTDEEAVNEKDND